jgi:hypothetical protein
LKAGKKAGTKAGRLPSDEEIGKATEDGKLVIDL